MVKVIILGAGKIGKAIAAMLANCPDYSVCLADNHPPCPSPSQAQIRHDYHHLDVLNEEALSRLLSSHDYVISALPFFLNPKIAQCAARQVTHYFDLTEDIKTARIIKQISKEADTVFAPQCGLAPGFISIIAHDLISRFDEAYDVHLRVGALPQFPDNTLKYNLTWSTDGLINEYCNPCEAIYDSQLREVLPLEGLESFTLDGMRYEAFNTSGGIGSLCETLQKKVRNLNYKTVRYPGHRDFMRMMCTDLRLCERRDVFRDLIEHAIPITKQDVVLIFVTVNGLRHGILEQETYVKKIYADTHTDGFSAIQKTTAAGVCTLLDMHNAGEIKKSGFLRPEEIPLSLFLSNRFGGVYT